MGPGYDIHFDCAAEWTDELWLAERRRRVRSTPTSKEQRSENSEFSNAKEAPPQHGEAPTTHEESAS